MLRMRSTFSREIFSISLVVELGIKRVILHDSCTYMMSPCMKGIYNYAWY
jgi:hypothetical protein